VSVVDVEGRQAVGSHAVDLGDIVAVGGDGAGCRLSR
jgi:hypothetical protein